MNLVPKRDKLDHGPGRPVGMILNSFVFHYIIIYQLPILILVLSYYSLNVVNMNFK